MCDFDLMEGWITHSLLKEAMAAARPDDAGRMKPRLGRADSSRKDNCAYCAYREQPKPGSPQADPAHAQHYLYGTGDGNHSPHGCMRFKTFLAYGGDGGRYSTLTQFFHRMLRPSLQKST